MMCEYCETPCERTHKNIYPSRSRTMRYKCELDRQADATACWGNNLGVGTCFARMPSCCVNAVSWLQASYGSPNLRGRFQPSQGTHQILTFPLQNSFQVRSNSFRKGGEGLTLQLYRPIPGISIKMSPERARACKLAFQTARLGAYQRMRMHSWLRHSDSNFPPSVA